VSNELVSDAEVERALDFLRDVQAIGEAKSATVRAEKMTKHIVALEMKKHNDLPVSAQKREAEASVAYLEALMKEAQAAGEYEKAKALRESAATDIEVWRSAGANYRAMKI
jgi:excinuclease UvrABC helicase subunit UvrB